MDLLDLRVFQRFFILRSMTGVARELKLSQPTVSYRLSKIEKELGAKLYDYMGDYFFTDAAKLLYRFCENVLSEYEALKEKVRTTKHLRVTLSMTAAYRYLDVIYDILYQLEYQPDLVSTTSLSALEELVEGESFAALVGGFSGELPKGILSRELDREEVRLLHPRDLPDDLPSIPLFLDDRGSGLNNAVRTYLADREDITILGEMGTAFDKLKLARSRGAGFFIPEVYLSSLNLEGLVLSETYRFSRPIFLLYRESDKDHEVILSLIEKLNR
jgi:DNA-binding transcriptional LysR family regulator